MKTTVLRTPLGEPSLAAVWAIVHHVGPGARHIELLGALKELQTLSGRKLEQLPARLRGLRFLFERIRDGNALAAVALVELKRQTGQAISFAATVDPTIGKPVPLTYVWQALLDKVQPARSRSVLKPFAQYCSAWAIAPDAVTDVVAANYIEALEAARFLAKPRDQHRAVCRHWNEAAATVEGWPAGDLKIPDYRPPMRALPWDAFPASLRADVDAYIATKQKPAGRRLRRTAGDASGRWKDSTARLAREHIRLAASAAAHQGTQIDSLRSLADLVQPDTVERALIDYGGNKDEPSNFVRDLGARLHAIARDLGLEQAKLEELATMARELNVGREFGLTTKNMAVVRNLMDPVNRKRLMGLPAALFARADEMDDRGQAPQRAAVLTQVAIAIQILIVAPMRISNLAGLTCGQHIVETRAGGPHTLVVPAQEVKNGVSLEYPLPSAADGLLRRYLTEFRPRLVTDENDWLCPGRSGPKCPRTLSQQITERLEAELGFHMVPHQFRHAAAAWLLLANPGNYEAVRRLLGHKQLQTTINFYVGLESIAAARQYQEMLLRDMQEDEA